MTSESQATLDDTPDYGESGLVFQLPIGGPSNLRAWITNAESGDAVVYFIGHLAVARGENSPFGEAKAARAGRVADIALQGAHDGQLSLSQKRVADGCFVYLARRTRH